MNYRFRNVEKDDIDGILDIAIQLGYPASQKTVTDLVDLAIIDQDHQIIIAEASDRLLGYIHLHYVALEGEPGKVEVSGILIPNANRNKGIGSRFLKEAEKWTRGRDLHTISIRTSLVRPEAIPFFNHFGFRNDIVQDAFVKELL